MWCNGAVCWRSSQIPHFEIWQRQLHGMRTNKNKVFRNSKWYTVRFYKSFLETLNPQITDK
jgi:hypothetical protein